MGPIDSPPCKKTDASVSESHDYKTHNIMLLVHIEKYSKQERCTLSHHRRRGKKMRIFIEKKKKVGGIDWGMSGQKAEM